MDQSDISNFSEQDISEGVLGQRTLRVDQFNASEIYQFTPLSSRRVYIISQFKDLTAQKPDAQFGNRYFEIQKFCQFSQLNQREQALLLAEESQITNDIWDSQSDLQKYNIIQGSPALQARGYQFLTVEFHKKFQEINQWRRGVTHPNRSLVPISSQSLQLHKLNFIEQQRNQYTTKPNSLSILINFDAAFTGAINQKEVFENPSDIVLKTFQNGMREVLINGVPFFRNLNDLVTQHNCELILYSHENQEFIIQKIENMISIANQRMLPFPAIQAIAVCNREYFQNVQSIKPILYKELNRIGGVWIIGCSDIDDNHFHQRNSIAAAFGFQKSDKENNVVIVDVQAYDILKNQGYPIYKLMENLEVFKTILTQLQEKKLPVSTTQRTLLPSGFLRFSEIPHIHQSTLKHHENSWNQNPAKVDILEKSEKSHRFLNEILTPQFLQQFDQVLAWKKQYEVIDPKQALEFSQIWFENNNLQRKWIREIKKSKTNKFLLISIENCLGGLKVPTPLRNQDILIKTIDEKTIQVLPGGYAILRKLDQMASRLGYDLVLYSKLQQHQQIQILDALQKACNSKLIHFPQFIATVVFDSKQFFGVPSSDPIYYQNFKNEIWVAGYGIQLENRACAREALSNLLKIKPSERVDNIIFETDPQALQDLKVQNWSFNYIGQPSAVASTVQPITIFEAFERLYQTCINRQFNSQIIGQSNEVMELQKFMSANAIRAYPMILVSSNPAGKSLIAQRYSQFFRSVVWLNIGKYRNIMFDLQIYLYENYGVPLGSKSQEEYLNEFYNRVPEKSCIVFDGLENDDQTNEFMQKPYLISMYAQGSVVIGTSRNNSSNFPMMKITGFSQNETLEFLKARLETFDQSDLELFGNQFKGLPLISEIAGSYKQRNKVSATYLLESILRSLEKFEYEVLFEDDKQLLGMLNLVFQELKELRMKKFLEVMVMFSYLNFHAISPWIMENFTDSKLTDEIEILVDFSLAYWDGTQLMVNETIQNLLRIILKGEKDTIPILQRFILYLSNLISSQLNSNEPGRLKVLNELIPHAFNTFENKNISDDQKFELYNEVSLYFSREANNPAIAAFYCQKLLQFKEIDNLTRINALGTLAVARGDEQNFEEQVKILQYLIEAKQSHYGDGHQSLEPTYMNLGSALANLKKFTESKDMFLKALQVERAKQIPQSVSTALTYFNLALVCQFLKDKEGTVGNAQQSYDIFKAKRGEDNVQTKAAREMIDNPFK